MALARPAAARSLSVLLAAHAAAVVDRFGQHIEIALIAGFVYLVE